MEHRNRSGNRYGVPHNARPRALTCFSLFQTTQQKRGTPFPSCFFLLCPTRRILITTFCVCLLIILFCLPFVAVFFCMLLPLFVAFVCLSNQNSCRYDILMALRPGGKRKGFVLLFRFYYDWNMLVSFLERIPNLKCISCICTSFASFSNTFLS